jgi:hypothetical protein
MIKYVLECPSCVARFELKKYEPESRVRCRKCKAVVVVPSEPGGGTAQTREEKPLDPELRKKLIGILSLRKLALISSLLALALAGGIYILLRRGESPSPESAARVPERVTLARMPELNRHLAQPLGRAFSWEYVTSSGQSEEWKVVQVGVGPEQEPEFDLQMSTSAGGYRRTLRVLRDGVHLMSEIRPDGRYVYAPPLKLVPMPMHLDDAWEYAGEARKEGGGSEKWSVRFVGLRGENVDSRAGKLPCIRVELSGTVGARRLDESLWYALGVGLVKREIRADGRAEETLLRKYSRSP